MKLLKSLYVSDIYKKREKKILRKLRRGKKQLNLFLIVIPGETDSQLEIVDSLFLEQPLLRDEQAVLAGLACGHEEALELVGRIASETYENTGTLNIREYLEGKEKATRDDIRFRGK